MTNKARNPVKSVQRTIRIVETLRDLDGAGVTELADRVDMSKGTAHDYLSTLKEYGYVVQNGDTYSLGLGFFEIGEYARNQWKIYQVAKPEVEKLADETGELANLMVEEHGMGVYLHRARGENAVTLDTHTGTRRHLHRTALGKAILAHMSEEEVRSIIDHRGLPKATEHTITDSEELFEELDSIRERKYAFCNQERVEGLHCVAAPITTDEDNVLGAISVAGPSHRMESSQRIENVSNKILQTANVIQINVSFA